MEQACSIRRDEEGNLGFRNRCLLAGEVEDGRPPGLREIASRYLDGVRRGSEDEVVRYYGEDERNMSSSEFYGIFKTFVTSYRVSF